MKREIYPNKTQPLKLETKRLKKATISERNKELIQQFQNYLISKGSGGLRTAKLSTQLRRLAVTISFDYDKARKQNIQEIIASINQNKRHSEATKGDYRRVIKQFYTFYKEEDARFECESTRKEATRMYNFIEKEISATFKRRQIDPTEIITEEDVNFVLNNGCRTIKEKAFIKFLHETGLRAGEMLNIRRQDIEFKKNIGVAQVNGKTGRRAVQFTNSMPYLVQWLDVHPEKSPSSYVWLGESPNRMHVPLIHIGATKLVARCFNRAGLKKKYNLHWFRHSRASLLAPHLPEAILCKYMGWVLGSKQVKTYCHISAKQTEEAFLKLNGLSEVEEERKYLPQTCGCGTINDFAARYCFKCGNPLSVTIAMQDQETVKSETDKTIKEMMLMFQNPQLLKAFKDFKAQNG